MNLIIYQRDVKYFHGNWSLEWGTDPTQINKIRDEYKMKLKWINDESKIKKWMNNKQANKTK